MSTEAPRDNVPRSNEEKKARAAFKRTRTGCQTCRKRKMKCDEGRPSCGQCIKSKRDCIYQDVTFRHNQNPTLNAGGASLGKFYKGSGTYTQEQLTSFVPVKEHLQFAPTAIPGTPPGQVSTRQPVATTQPTSDHTLQTLAAAAFQHPPYPPPPYESYPTYEQQAVQARHVAQGAHNPNINALLNPSSTPTSLIDPNLEASMDRSNVGAIEGTANGEILPGLREHAGEEGLTETDTKLAHALQGFSDGHGQAPGGTGPQG